MLATSAPEGLCVPVPHIQTLKPREVMGLLQGRSRQRAEPPRSWADHRASTWRGVKATLEAVPDERSRIVDFPPYTTLCFCRVRCGGAPSAGVRAVTLLSHRVRPTPPGPNPHLQCLGDPGFGGLVHLCLPHTPTARLAQVAQAEAQVLLVGILLDLVGQEASCS